MRGTVARVRAEADRELVRPLEGRQALARPPPAPQGRRRADHAQPRRLQPRRGARRRPRRQRRGQAKRIGPAAVASLASRSVIPDSRISHLSPMDAAIFGLIVADLIAEPMDLRRPPAPGGLAIAQLDHAHDRRQRLQHRRRDGQARHEGRRRGAGRARTCSATRSPSGCARRGSTPSAVFADERAQTSATVVAVEPGGERCFFHTPGVTKLLDADAFRRCFPMFKQCRVRADRLLRPAARADGRPARTCWRSCEQRAPRDEDRARHGQPAGRRGSCSSRSCRTSTCSAPAARRPPR